MSKIKQLEERYADLSVKAEEFRKETDGRALSAEERTKWEQHVADLKEAKSDLDTERSYLDTQRARLAAELPQGGQSDGGDLGEAFRSYLATGDKSALEARAAIDGMNGDVTIPSSIFPDIEKALKAYGGILQEATIITTSGGGDLIFPTVNDTAARAQIIGEYEPVGTRKPALGQKVLKAYTYTTNVVPISLELIQDSAFDIQALVSSLLLDEYNRGLSYDFTNGTGVNQPTGILTAAPKGADALATSIDYDDIINLMKSVNSAYGRNAKFMFNNNTLFELALLVDDQGRPLWMPNLAQGFPQTIMGRQFAINEDMPDIGAGASSMLFGDLSKYKARVVRQFGVTRLNETYATSRAIGLMGFGRADGTLIDAGTNPVKKLTHAGA